VAVRWLNDFSGAYLCKRGKLYEIMSPDQQKECTMKSSLGMLLNDKGGEVYSVTPDTTVLKAVQRMNDLHIGALLVIVSDKVQGIFTERDILSRVVAVGMDPGSVAVSKVMTTKLAVVRPETTVEDAIRICTKKRCRHLPVMEDDKLLGVISSGDLANWITRSQKTEIQNLIHYISGQYPA
jgi:CBS domain-containing protein